MKRDPRLQGLSSQHHQALVLARSLTREPLAWDINKGAELGARFDSEINPHFLVEEEILLPALRLARANDLVERTENEHATLRSYLLAARQGDAQAARRFGELLHDHVRFEERELFLSCETLLPSRVLDEVVMRAVPLKQADIDAVTQSTSRPSQQKSVL